FHVYKAFAEEKRFDKCKSVFLFASNTDHHTPEHALYSRKSGAGLAAAADQLYTHEIPSLGLPTTGMPPNITRDQIPNNSCAINAINDIWSALGFGLNVVCPVRKRQDGNPLYFSAPLTEDNKEARLWGSMEITPNLALGDYYHEQLRLIYSATTYEPQNQNDEKDEKDKVFDPILFFLEENRGKVNELFINAYTQGKKAAERVANFEDLAELPWCWYQEPLTWNIPEEKEFAEGFKKIYAALRDGQSGFDCFKTNFIAGKEHLTPEYFIKKIKEHAKEFPNSRTAKALRLAKKYARNGEDIKDNTNLFKEIYTEAFAASGFGLFRQSKITQKTIWKIEKLKAALNEPSFSIPANREGNSRTMAIKRALNP
ncbi:MAG: hypothetical protein K0S63_1265, partial [Gammaproteobacteria bacterium]|nr:hypothetical protein [Gammaproteobacteria bacterium]